MLDNISRGCKIKLGENTSRNSEIGMRPIKIRSAFPLSLFQGMREIYRLKVDFDLAFHANFSVCPRLISNDDDDQMVLMKIWGKFKW
jgi:hypothetical protein